MSANAAKKAIPRYETRRLLPLLLLDPRQKHCRPKPMLRLGPVHHADNHHADRLDIHCPTKGSGLVLRLS